MAISSEQIAFVEELFAPVGQITTRKMFGALGVFHAGKIFGVLSRDGGIYLKGKNGFEQDLIDAGGTQFMAGGDKPMPYWTLSEDALDDPEVASEWAKRAIWALEQDA